MLFELLAELQKQCGDSFEKTGLIVSKPYCEFTKYIYENVEIITAVDRQLITTGEKRNQLLEWASNDYIVFHDCDDWPAPYYVKEILDAIQSGCDCIATNGTMTTDGGNEIKWKLSKDYPNDTITENGRPVYIRTTNHISPVKRELALKAMFPNISNGEDKEYSERLKPLLKTEAIIEKPIYHYRYSTKNKLYK